jgi:hypothetical protein
MHSTIQRGQVNDRHRVQSQIGPLRKTQPKRPTYAKEEDEQLRFSRRGIDESFSSFVQRRDIDFAARLFRANLNLFNQIGHCHSERSKESLVNGCFSKQV